MVGRGSGSPQLVEGVSPCPTPVPPRENREEAQGLPGAAGQAELSLGGQKLQSCGSGTSPVSSQLEGTKGACRDS